MMHTGHGTGARFLVQCRGISNRAASSMRWASLNGRNSGVARHAGEQGGGERAGGGERLGGAGSTPGSVPIDQLPPAEPSK